ncbi:MULTISPECIES: hypothetical protein [unclassified Streptomyces]|uniref:hypothetical protein n=1 Tax=unclassified Streptomyces TaxID=2593676 RepID=UPI002E0F9860|nr:hypothetical protein OG457_23685 [Streptomyces sp. NBC_01207]
MRPRIHRITWPRPALVLTDTPDPDCTVCRGEGGQNCDYGDYETGEYAGTEWEPCHCWDETRRWVLIPLLRLPRRRRTSPDPWASAHNNEPPF